DADAFGAGMIRRGRLAVLDERGDRAVLRAADADALPDALELVRARVRTRFRIGDVDRIVRGNRDAARSAELAPLVEQVAVLIENLDAVVLAVADKQAPARVDRDRVRLAQLAAAGSLPAPLLDESPVAAELHHPVVLAVAMAVGDEDVAVWRDD